jgi:hypothetical protein
MDLGNPNSLRVVETVTDLIKVEERKKKGHMVLFETCEPKEELYRSRILFKELATGKFSWAEDRFMVVQYGSIQYFSEEEYEQVITVREYPRQKTLTRSWGAYILPLNISIGERVYVEDLLQDVSMGDFWSSTIMAHAGEAVWDGEKLIFDETLWEDHGLVG